MGAYCRGRRHRICVCRENFASRNGFHRARACDHPRTRTPDSRRTHDRIEAWPGRANRNSGASSAIGDLTRMAIENKKTPQIRILIADDHPIFRDGLKRLLESEREFKVIGEACDGVDAVTLVRQLKPEVLLLDLAMPRRAGLEALRE